MSSVRPTPYFECEFESLIFDVAHSTHAHRVFIENRINALMHLSVGNMQTEETLYSTTMCELNNQMKAKWRRSALAAV